VTHFGGAGRKMGGRIEEVAQANTKKNSALPRSERSKGEAGNRIPQDRKDTRRFKVFTRGLFSGPNGKKGSRWQGMRRKA